MNCLKSIKTLRKMNVNRLNEEVRIAYDYLRNVRAVRQLRGKK